MTYFNIRDYAKVIDRILRLLYSGKPVDMNIDICFSNFKTTILIIACEYRYSVETVQLLLDSGADINARDDHGCTALIRACSRLNPDPNVIRLLVYRGANIHIIDNDHCNAYQLYSVLNHSNKNIKRLLLGEGDKAAAIIQRRMKHWLWAPYTRDGKVGLMPARLWREILELQNPDKN